MEEKRKYANAKAVRDEEFMDWEAPLSGRLYRLRKVSMMHMMRDGTFSIEESEKLEEARRKIEEGIELDPFDRAVADLYQRAMVCRGVVDENGLPWVVDKSAKDCAPGELSIHEFPKADYDLIFLAIAMHSGLSAAKAAELESVVSEEPVEGDRFRPEADGGSALPHEVEAEAERADH